MESAVNGLVAGGQPAMVGLPPPVTHASTTLLQNVYGAA